MGQVINNKVIDIEGETKPRGKTVGEMIAEGDLEAAEAAVRESGNLARQDLSSSALLADIRAGESEQRQGRNPSMALTKSRQFEGEQSSPLALSEAFRARRGKEAGAERDDRRINILADQFRTNTLLSLDQRAGLIRKTEQLMRGKTEEQKVKILGMLMKSSDSVINAGTADSAVLEQNLTLKEIIKRKLIKLTK